MRFQVPHPFWHLIFPSLGALATGVILNEARLALLAWEELLLFTSPRIYPWSHGQNENPRSISWLPVSHPPSSWTWRGNYDGNLGLEDVSLEAQLFISAPTLTPLKLQLTWMWNGDYNIHLWLTLGQIPVLFPCPHEGRNEIQKSSF